MPSVGWAILAVIWFKVSDFTVVFVQVMILLPFSLINFAEGLRNLDREVIEMAESFARRRATTIVKVVIPMLMPYGVAALRVSYGVCWKIALDLRAVRRTERARLPDAAGAVGRRRDDRGRHLRRHRHPVHAG